MVNFLCAPLHIPLIYVCIHGGEWLFHVPRTKFSIRYYASLVWDDPMRFLDKFGSTAFHASVVWAICAPFWIAILYYSLLPMLREIAILKAETAAKSLAGKPPTHPVP